MSVVNWRWANSPACKPPAYIRYNFRRQNKGHIHMNGELKDFVLRKQDEHTKNLALFKTFERIRYFGKNVFIIGGIDDPDDSDLSGPIEKVIHVAILLACLLLIGGKYWIIKALIVYALIHYILQKLGKYFIDTYKEKLDEIAKECQERLNSFCQEQYQKYEIVWGNEYGEILFDGLMIKNGCFEADLGVECGPIDIYCLSDTVAGERYKAEKAQKYPNGNNVYIDMKKNIASTEFNKKMGVLTLPKKEHECMKFLSTSCQLAIVQAAGNNIVREIHIWQGKLHITMMQAFGRADANIAVYAENAIVNAFGAVEYSCSQIQHQEELVRSCYQSLTE